MLDTQNFFLMHKLTELFDSFFSTIQSLDISTVCYLYEFDLFKILFVNYIINNFFLCVSKLFHLEYYFPAHLYCHK